MLTYSELIILDGYVYYNLLSFSLLFGKCQQV